MGTLYLVATPIGNLEDITPRALRTLREVALIAAEDTRHTGRLLARFGIDTPMISYHAFNERSRRERLLAALAEGDVALVTDAGTPGVADPGRDVVEAAFHAGYRVSPIPGPSALTAAISASGLIDGPFLVLGFLPRAGRERKHALGRAATSGAPVVLFEAPGRLVSTLRELAALLGNRTAVVARELTKLHEDIRRDSLLNLAAAYDEEGVKGEIVIVVDGADNENEGTTSAEDPVAVVAALLRSGLKPSEAAREAAKLTGLPRSQLYELARNPPETSEKS
ncbi:MAG TPA: 16S rRNA (cytidine(1402)-2'-O)-methyltransferase [Thermomicrobiales bacterium]|nr:16S rRNA (cytidine(1402)-2'-O)-methyltransferase [Thermomicrobiales bacterium]